MKFNGFGRTGKLFGFQNYDVVPDILVMSKVWLRNAVGALPLLLLIWLLKDNPKMGHITTFGGSRDCRRVFGHFAELTETNLMMQVLEKEKLFRKYLQHPKIVEIRGRRLMLTDFRK